MTNTNHYRLHLQTENSPKPVGSQADDLQECKNTIDQIKALSDKKDKTSFEILDIFGGNSKKKQLEDAIQALEKQLESNPALPNSEHFNIEILYGTLIEYFDLLKKEAKTPEEKTYFDEKSAMSSLYLEEYRYIKENIKRNNERIQMYETKGYITKENYTALQKEIQNIHTPLQNDILEYVNIFKANACGSQKQQNLTIEPAKKVLTTYQITSKKIHSFENTLINHLLDSSKEHAFNENIQKEALTLIHNIHGNRIDNAMQQIMILSDLRNIETFHGESDISVKAIPVPKKHITAQRDAIQLSLQNNANEILREFSPYKQLKDPSIVNEQGRKQITSDILTVIEEKFMPEFAKNAILSLEGEEAQTSVTQYFQDFFHNSAYKNYMQNLQHLANPNDEIYTLMNTPTPENKEKVETFIKELQHSEKVYLEEFYILTQKLLKKGVSHEQIDQIWKFITKHPLEILGVVSITSIGTWALAKKILKSIGKNISKRVLWLSSLLVVDEKMLNNSMNTGNNWL